jgi:di/tricarboxylate transporter
MPLSFAASLGTTITIIGAPAFLIASDILRRNGRPGLGIFSIAPIGLSLSLVGTLFILLFGRWLLPARKGDQDQAERFRLNDYFTELAILPESALLDKTREEIETDESNQIKVVGWVRDGRPLPRPFDDRRVTAGDVLLVRAAPEDIIAVRQEPGIELRPVEEYGAPTSQASQDAEDAAEQLVQVVVAPNSDLAGRTLGEIDFRRRFGAVVVSLWRRDAWLDQQIAKIRLRAGDVLVLEGDEDALARVQNDRQFLMMLPFHGELRLRRKARLASAIMLVTIILAALNIFTIEMAALAGAIAVVLTRCITPRQAYRAIDVRIFVFIAGALPLGAAMEKTGASKLMAVWLQRAVGGWNEIAVLLALFAVVAVITQFMSDSATTALFAPVAVALARALGRPPEPYVVTVAMASVAAFLTPIGHHGNLLVYGPGRYEFGDFVKVGTPLTILAGIVVAVLAPLIWRG